MIPDYQIVAGNELSIQCMYVFILLHSHGEKNFNMHCLVTCEFEHLVCSWRFFLLVNGLFINCFNFSLFICLSFYFIGSLCVSF